MVHGAKVVHHLPGRLRVRLPRSKRDPHLLEQVRDFVQGLGGVCDVEINPVTGSVLVHYRPESESAIHSLLAQASTVEAGEEAPPLLTEADEMAVKIEKEAEFLAAHSEVAKQMVTAVSALNQQVREATGNMVDLKVLLPAGLAVWAFLKAGADVATPLWVTLAIFSFHSFVSLHHPTTMNVSTHTTNIG